PHEHVEVAVDWPVKMLANQPCRFEVELPAAEKVDVERVELRRVDHGLESQPDPRGHATSKDFASAFIVEVPELDAVVRLRYLDEPCVWRDVAERRQKLRRARCEIAADLDERNDLPIVRDRGIEAAQRVADATPLLDGHASIAAVDHVPDDRSDDPDPFRQA